MARSTNKEKKVSFEASEQKQGRIEEEEQISQGSSSESEHEGTNALEENDEFDIDKEVEVSDEDREQEEDTLSSEGEEDEEAEDEDEEDSFPLKKKRKKNVDDGSESFATAFNAILGSKLKAYDRKDPILVRNKTTLKQIENDTLEQKAKRAILAEKKQKMDKHRIRNLLPASDQPENVRKTIEFERQLKKTAQKGVVRLFNAVLATQVGTNLQISKEKVGLKKKEELMTEISKEKFLDLVQAAGQS